MLLHSLLLVPPSASLCWLRQLTKMTVTLLWQLLQCSATTQQQQSSCCSAGLTLAHAMALQLRGLTGAGVGCSSYCSRTTSIEPIQGGRTLTAATAAPPAAGAAA
jgi:hypothetical protein